MTVDFANESVDFVSNLSVLYFNMFLKNFYLFCINFSFTLSAAHTGVIMMKSYGFIFISFTSAFKSIITKWSVHNIELWSSYLWIKERDMISVCWKHNSSEKFLTSVNTFITRKHICWCSCCYVVGGNLIQGLKSEICFHPS